MTTSKPCGKLKVMEKEITLLTTAEAARRLKISRQGIAYLTKVGHLKPMQNIKGKFKFYTQEEIDRYKYRRRKK